MSKMSIPLPSDLSNVLNEFQFLCRLSSQVHPKVWRLRPKHDLELYEITYLLTLWEERDYFKSKTTPLFFLCVDYRRIPSTMVHGV